jgi:WD40 repeat protein
MISPLLLAVLWDIYGECKNYNVLSGHKSAVLQVCWPTPYSIVSCSADKTVATWDANKGIRTRKFLEHTAVVNSCAVAADAPHLIASGSDDCTVILWDARARQSVASIYHDYQVCAVCLSSDGQSVCTGGIDNTIRRFDLRSGARSGWDAAKLQDLDQPDLVLEGHTDTITGLALSPDGCSLLSNAMDSQMRLWNVRPFSAGQADSGDSRVLKRHRAAFSFAQSIAIMRRRSEFDAFPCSHLHISHHVFFFPFITRAVRARADGRAPRRREIAAAVRLVARSGVRHRGLGGQVSVHSHPSNLCGSCFAHTERGVSTVSLLTRPCR